MNAAKAFAASWLALCIAAKLFALDESTLIVQVEAVGSAETRDESFLDACRQCITKVHGVRLAGRMTRVGGQFVKATADAKVDSGWLKKSLAAQATAGIQGVEDTTAVAFGGLITAVETVSETQKDSRWLVHVKADVMGRLPDKFAGKEAVVIPGVEQLAAKFGAQEGLFDLPEVISQRLIQAAQDCFGLRKEYVLLERDNETALDAELSRAVEGGNAARVETAKLQAEKVADSMLVFEVQPLRLREHQDNLRGLIIHHAAITPQATIKLVDLATRGVIATSVLRMEECSSQSESSRLDAMHQLRRELLGRIDGAISVAYSQLFWEFSPFTARIDDKGFIVPMDSVVSQTLPSIHRIEILKPGQSKEDDPIQTILHLAEGRIDSDADIASLPTDQRILPYRILSLQSSDAALPNSKPVKSPSVKPNNRSVVFSTLTSLEASLSGGDPSLQPLAAKLAREIHQSVRSHFQGRKEYVILDRANEEISENELDRTVGANTAEFERNKLGKERAADLALVFDFGAIDASAASQQIKKSGSLNYLKVSLSGNIKLIDVATKSEITQANFAIGPAEFSSAGNISGAAMQAETNLLQSVGACAAMTMSEVFWNLGQNFAQVRSDGVIDFESSAYTRLLKDIGQIRIASMENSTKKRLSEGVDYEVEVNGGVLKLKNPPALPGKSVLFKITALRKTEHIVEAPKDKAVIFGTLTDLEASLSAGDPSLQLLAAKLAREIHQSVRSHFQGRKEYVILDRANEAATDSELERTVGANTAEFERNKLGKERAADLALVFDFGAIDASAASQQFKFADSLNQVSISLSGSLKLIDVATKAEIAQAELKVGPVSASSIGGTSSAAMQAEAKLLKSIGSSSAMAMSEVFWNLGQNLGRVGKNGILEARHPIRSALAKEIHILRAAPVDESTQKRLGDGKDYVVQFNGTEMSLEDAEDLAGKNVLFKITALHSSEAISDSGSKAATEKAGSILDKFK